MKLKTIEALTKAGWTPGRSVPTNENEVFYYSMVEHLKDDRNIFHEPARKFLSEFSGLGVRYQLDREWYLDLNVVGTMRLESQEELPAIGSHYVPKQSRMDTMFGMDSQGRVWDFCSHSIVAETGEDFLDWVIDGGVFKQKYPKQYSPPLNDPLSIWQS